jgi:para-nitrobenzyl esterase
MGAYHGAETPYVFNTHDEWLPTTETDHTLTEVVMDYWVQFARNGDPNLPGRPHWPIYTQENQMVMGLGKNVGVIQAPDTRLCELLPLGH